MKILALLIFIHFLPSVAWSKSDTPPKKSNEEKAEKKSKQGSSGDLLNTAPLTGTGTASEIEVRLSHFKKCVDQAHLAKLESIDAANKGQYDSSLKWFGMVRDAYMACTQILPQDPTAYYTLPESYRYAKKDYLLDFADLFFQYALIMQDDENPEHNADTSIAALEQAVAKIEEGCAVIEDAACGSKKQTFYTVMGDAYRLKKMTDKALEMFEKANVYRPDDPANLSFWGLALYEKGRKKEAFEKWRMAVSKDPTAPAADMIKQFQK